MSGPAESSLSTARLAAAGGFFTQGLVFISLTTPAAGPAGPLGPGLGGVVPAAADDGAARGGRLTAGRTGRGASRQRPGPADRAAGDRGRGAGGDAGADVRGLRHRARGVRRGAGRGRRRDQHAGGRAGAPLRPGDPAVVPRRLDARRRRRLGDHAGDRDPAARRGRGAGRRTPARERLALPAPGRRAGERADRGAVATDPAGRPGAGALLHGRHRSGHVGTGLPRRHLLDNAHAGGAGHAALPAGQSGVPARRRRPGHAVRCRAGAARGRRAVRVRPGRRRLRPELAGRRARLHRPRRRGRGHRAAELLGGRPDRRRAEQRHR